MQCQVEIERAFLPGLLAEMIAALTDTVRLLSDQGINVLKVKSEEEVAELKKR